MKYRGVTGLLAVGCVALAVIGFLASQSQDRTAPKITVKKEDISYTAGDDYDNLLKGVTAKDNRDGNLTDQIFVDRIVQTGDDSAIVYYAVTDKANNVGTAKRKIQYSVNDGSSTDTSAEDKQNDDQQTQEGQQTQTENDAQISDGRQAAQDAANQDTLTPNGENPVMELTTTQMTIAKGETFDRLSVVKDAVDDKDDRNTLYQHIHADGKFDTKKAGTYQLTYYVNDSDGHTSDPITFTLTVQ